MKRAAILWAVLIGVWAGLAAGATLTVPDQYPTITEALAAAQPGDEIVVNSGYVGDTETFPILVQKDNITIRVADGESVTITGRDSHAVFVVGAYRVYDPGTKTFVYRTVKNVTIQGFTIGDFDDGIVEDIGIVVKKADGVVISGNTVRGTLEGIRLIEATNCTIEDNTVLGAWGVGIFVELSSDNKLLENTVVGCGGVGLFVFESTNNTIQRGEISECMAEGVVLNDSRSNTVSLVDIVGNEGWGLRLVFADGNTIDGCKIAGNLSGGIELIGAQHNVISGNTVMTNGDPDDYFDDPQILVTRGDKALFTVDLFELLNSGQPIAGFRGKKELVEDKAELLGIWAEDLGYEIGVLVQKALTVLGMINEEDPVDAIIAAIDELIAEKHAILRDPPNSTHITNTDLATGAVVFTTGSKMDDPAYNFTLEAAKTQFQFGGLDYDFLDLSENGALDDFGLAYPPNGEDYSWDKVGILEILIASIRNEVYELKDDLEDLLREGWITQDDRDAIKAKLDAVLGALTQIEDDIDELKDVLASVDERLEAAKNALGQTPPDYAAAETDVKAAKQALEDWLNQHYYGVGGLIHNVGVIVEKLCLVNVELPPEPRVNGYPLVGKKETPLTEADPYELETIASDITSYLNLDPSAHAIAQGLQGSGYTVGNIVVDDKDLRESWHNTISSNFITSDLQNANASNVGIVLMCKHNTVVNNLITNEGVKPWDDEAEYGFVHRLDVGIILLANENRILFNAIEWIDVGIIRGGDWEWSDHQTVYEFHKLATIAYWPGPGELVGGDFDCGPVEPGGLHYPPQRPVDYAAVLLVSTRPSGLETEARVKWNRLTLNLFDHCGAGIMIRDAESNVIDENLFYFCGNGGIVFANGFMPGITIQHNDFYGGWAVVNLDPGTAVDASDNYTPPEGQPGHAPVVGPVNPPNKTSPFAYDNFRTPDKFEALGITDYYWGDSDWGGLPPNPRYFPAGFELPEEKPRDPRDIFGPGQASQFSTHTFAAGWRMVSVPLDPSPNAPMAVFGDDLGGRPLYIFTWPPEDYDPPPTQISPTVGYWVYFYDDTTVDVEGTACSGDVAVPLGDAGWHMISSCSLPVVWDGVEFELNGDRKSLTEAASAGWLAPFAWTYDPSQPDGYLKLEPGQMALLDPWTGYWIYTKQNDLVMILPIGDTQPPSPPLPPSALSEFDALDLTPPPPPTLPLGAEGLLVRNVPNPVRDVHTTTFQVLAAGVERMRVSVYDLTGKLVWQGEAAGNELVWHTDDLTGAFLANGVYLYRVEAKIAGQWVATGLLKLVIIR